MSGRNENDALTRELQLGRVSSLTSNRFVYVGSGFGVNMIWPLGRYYTLEASQDLLEWVPITTGRAPFTYEDVETINLPGRCYRAIPVE